MGARARPRAQRCFVLALVLALGLALPAGARTEGFLSEPTDQLGAPGYLAGSELTPSGSLYTGWAELEFRYGRALRLTDGLQRELLGGQIPVLSYRVSDGSVRYAVTIACVATGGRPVDYVRVRWRNAGRRPASATWASDFVYAGGAVRPDGSHTFRFRRPAIPARTGLYDQPGVAFDPGWQWAFDGDVVRRGGQAMLMFGGGSPAVRRRLVLRPGGSRAAVTETTPFARVQYHQALAPGAGGQVDFALPVVPVAPGDPALRSIRATGFDSALARTRRFWTGVFARSARISVPEAKVQDTFYASLANMILSRYRTAGGDWVQTTNKLQYNATWLRDGAFIAHALDLAGRHDLAGQDIAFFRRWQQADGLFISRPNQYDGLGEALWAIGDHVARSGDMAFARLMLGPVTRAVDWLDRERATEPWGLLPASDPGDDELVSGHITGDNLLAADGLQAAVDLARRLHAADLLARFSAARRAFLAALAPRLSGAEARTGGGLPPSLEARGGQDWGNLWAAYPEPVLAPGSAAVSATLARARARFREGIATYYDGRALHDYLGFRVFETELERGEQSQVVAGLYSELAHTSATGGGFEVGMRPGGSRSLPGDLAPHGWFAAEYVTLLRNMLVRENGAQLELLGAVPPGWLAPGRRISARGIDTLRGRIALTLQAVPGGAVLRWRGDLTAGTSLVWPVPAAARAVHAPGLRGGLIHLRGAAGALRVRWRLHGPFPSYAATFRHVLALHGA